MNVFLEDIQAQPQALRDLARMYEVGENAALLAQFNSPRPLLLTGMGASFHAAAICAFTLQHAGIAARAVEASELLFYSTALLQDVETVVFVSQSGASAEVLPVVELLAGRAHLVGVTNDPASPLGQHAQVTLPLFAGFEHAVATRTYVNTLALLWLFSRQLSGALNQNCFAHLRELADAGQTRIEQAEQGVAQWLDVLAPARQIVFLGHGPHAITARHAAMMLSEWGKVAATSANIGAFRHGLIESVDADTGIVLFAPNGRGTASTLALADELRGYGARVLCIEYGQVQQNNGPVRPAFERDEFLAPLLDAVAAQLFVEALARQRGVPAGFRYISKVVSRL